MEFTKFPKIARYSREVIVTEKLDGTNATIVIGEAGEFLTGSKNQWITPQSDNQGFSSWANNNKNELLNLGPGWHRGEWWGKKIQRSYGLTEQKFSLFNVIRWVKYGEEPKQISTENEDPRIIKMQQVLPKCVDLVPILWRGNFDDLDANKIIEDLKEHGSYAVPGFMNPEGIVIYHVAGNVCFKKTVKKDDKPKGKEK